MSRDERAALEREDLPHDDGALLRAAEQAVASIRALAQATAQGQYPPAVTEDLLRNIALRLDRAVEAARGQDDETAESEGEA